MILIPLGYATGQTAQDPQHALLPCVDSPTPGKRAPNTDCAVLTRKEFGALPEGPLVLRLETFQTTEAAQQAGTPASAAVQAGGKVWLLTFGLQGQRTSGGQFVAEIGPIPPIPPAARYEMRVSEADFGPDMNPAVSNAIHTHSGPELWYLLTGEQCLETPNGTTRARAGAGMFAPAGIPMQLNIVGRSKRDALFVIIHDATKPATTVSDWRPKGTCQK